MRPLRLVLPALLAALPAGAARVEVGAEVARPELGQAATLTAPAAVLAPSLVAAPSL
ncbi:MAG: hypothetical protein HY079_15275, partial [Elusimicrobia bacterium]|nr:hypothetical protein [Elusimicrobiota bacterium]